MAISKSKKPPPPPVNTRDADELLKSDVASFASSIGLSSSLPNSGFNDSDFRKTGPLKPQTKPPSTAPPSRKPQPKDDRRPARREGFQNDKRNKPIEARPKPAIQPFSVDNNQYRFEKFKNLPQLPLVKASSLGVWYVDASELEEKVFGSEGKKVEYKNVDEWKSLVGKKKELAERLLAQYTHDYELSRGKNGDIKMLITTQRSGTAADKVSAFSVMVGENPVANMRSLDALLGNDTLQLNLQS